MTTNHNAVRDVEHDELPHYTAQAVIDLERQASILRDGSNALSQSALFEATQQALIAGHLAGLLRSAAHLVLPTNGEIYRRNRVDELPVAPSAEERVSLSWLPAPLTTFEFAVDSEQTERDLDAEASRRIVLAIDGRQMLGQSEAAYQVLLLSLSSCEERSRWSYARQALMLKSPLTGAGNDEMPGSAWGARYALLDLKTGPQIYPPAGPRSEWLFDLTTILQACHALQSGAELVEREHRASSPRCRYERSGAGGFRYQVLKVGPWANEGTGTQLYGARPVRLRNDDLLDEARTFATHCFGFAA